jgi:hypothetical protein
MAGASGERINGTISYLKDFQEINIHFCLLIFRLRISTLQVFNSSVGTIFTLY